MKTQTIILIILSILFLGIPILGVIIARTFSLSHGEVMAVVLPFTMIDIGIMFLIVFIIIGDIKIK